MSSVGYHKVGKADSGLFASTRFPRSLIHKTLRPASSQSPADGFLFLSSALHTARPHHKLYPQLQQLVSRMSAGSFEGSNASTEVQIEMPPLDYTQHGYHRLASAMGLLPDLAIFRRFSTLNVKNILYLQAELVYLEDQLEIAAQEDSLSGNTRRRNYDRDWFALSRADSFPDGSGRQWKIFSRIRDVLQQYSE